MADWSHQSRALGMLRENFRNGITRQVLAMPTGGGKTRVAGNLFEIAIRTPGQRCLYIADRRELVTQPAKAFQAMGLPVGIVMADAPREWVNPSAPIQIASKQSLCTGNYELPPADRVITDECHTSVTEVYKALMERYPEAWEIGLTATPYRGDGKGLGRRYGALVQPTTYAELQRNGVLVPVKCISTKPMAVGKAKGAKKPTGKNMVGDAVTWWKRCAQDGQTFTFARNVKHSMALRDEYRQAGISAIHIDGGMPQDEIDAAMDGFRSGKYKVICNCNMLKYGVDVPSASVLQIMAPFASLVDYRQSAGRIMRSCSGKTLAILIDHAGAVDYHLFPDMEVEVTLDDSIDYAEQHRAKGNNPAVKPMTCPQCYMMFQPRSTCPGCGWTVPAKMAQHLNNREGTLYEVQRPLQAGTGGHRPVSDTTVADLNKIWTRCLAITANKGGSFRQAAGMFMAQTKKKVTDSPVEPQPPQRWDTPVAEELPQYTRRKSAVA